MEKTIARMVLDRYENSISHVRGTLIGNMSFALGRHKPYQDDDSFEYRLAFNEAAKNLEKLDLIKIAWVQRDNIIDRIQFRLKDVPKLYDRFKIYPKGNIVSLLANQIKTVTEGVQTPWIKKYLADLHNEILAKKTIPSSLTNKIKRDNLFKALVGLDDNRESEMLERVFSKKYLGNSKAFEKDVRTRLVSIAKKYADINEGLSSVEILSELGIEKTTSELLLAGPLVIELGGKIIDLSGFRYGVGLNTKTLISLNIIAANFENVLSIENKANFATECENKEGWLLVFSSGYYSPRKREFLKKVRDHLATSGKKALYYHWGDLDCGGFNIYRQIKNQVFPDLNPYSMDVETYLKNIKYGETMSWSQTKNLKKLAEKNEMQEFEELLAEMLKHKKILEQETMLF